MALWTVIENGEGVRVWKWGDGGVRVWGYRGARVWKWGDRGVRVWVCNDKKGVDEGMWGGVAV